MKENILIHFGTLFGAW